MVSSKSTIIPSYSSSNAKGPLGIDMSNGLGSTLASSRVVIGWIYELVDKLHRTAQLRNMYSQRSFLLPEVKITL